jgi:hypothetical protein
MIIQCQSAIERVTVYAQRAVVTRRVRLPPELPAGAIELEIPGISPLAQPATMRATVAGTRGLLALRAPLQVPRAPAGPGASREQLRALEHRARRLHDEAVHVAERRARLAVMKPAPTIGLASALPSIDVRLGEGLAASALLDELAGRLAVRADELDEETRALSKQIEAARVALAQARSGEIVGEGHPTRSAFLRLSEAGQVSGVELSYVVAAARWWPLYTLRISEGGRGATLAMEALVAQLSGEDWRDARLSLASANLAHDARLPELPSLRLGRAQPPVRTGYRPAPQGLDELFAGYDRSFGQPAAPVETQNRPTEVIFSLQAIQSLEEARKEAPPPQGGPSGKVQDIAEEDEEETRGGFFRKQEARPSRQRLATPMAASMAAPMPQATRSGTLVGGGFALDKLGSAGGGAPQEPPEPPELEPSDDYLDFSRLRLAGASEARRGRLVRGAADASARLEEEARRAIEAASPPGNVRDPLASRGQFAHRYSAAGVAEIPSDGQGHLVPIAVAASAPRMLFRCVPREAPEVYREALITNPFDAPLLAGPAQIYVDGTLLTVTPIDRVGKGGTLRVGLGVEERLRVARNTRTQEGSSGLLGGSTTMTHSVKIELNSSLGRPAEVEVLERQPVTDDRAIEIERVSASPEPTAYDQADRGEPVRGGLGWRVTIPAGGAAVIEHQYRITLPAKCEIVGGNRRD